MKKVILIITILFWCGSLTAQTPEYKSLVFNNLDFDITKDSLIVKSPPFEGTFIVTPFILQPLTRFEIILEIPIDQVKQKSPQERHFKTQIAELLAIGTFIFVLWRIL